MQTQRLRPQGRSPTELVGDLIEAINELNEPSPDPAILARFPGWGRVPKLFTDDAASAAILRGREVLREALTDMQYASARASTLNQMFTPPWLVSLVWRSLGTLGFKNGSVLDLGCGIGQFNWEIPVGLTADYVGVEKDAVTAAIARHLHPAANIYRADALAWKYPAGQFQAVIGNIPFEDGSMATYGDFPHKVGLHARLILRGVDMLADGGVMALITTTGTLDSCGGKSEYALFRQYLFGKGSFLGAVRIPEGAFSSTSKTVDLLFFRKESPRSPYNDIGVSSTPTSLVGPDDRPIHLNRFFHEYPEYVIGDPYPDRASYGTSYGTRWQGTLEELELAIDCKAQKLALQSQPLSHFETPPGAVMTIQAPRFSWMTDLDADLPEPVAQSPAPPASNVVPIRAAESESWKRFKVDFARKKTGYVEIFFGDVKPPDSIITQIGRNGLGFAFSSKGEPHWWGPLNTAVVEWLNDMATVCGLPLLQRVRDVPRMTRELARLQGEFAVPVEPEEAIVIEAVVTEDGVETPIDLNAPQAAPEPEPVSAHPPALDTPEPSFDDWFSRLISGEFDAEIDATIHQLADRPYSKAIQVPRNTRAVQRLWLGVEFGKLQACRALAIGVQMRQREAAASPSAPAPAAPEKKQ